MDGDLLFLGYSISGLFHVLVQTHSHETGHSNENFRRQVRVTRRAGAILC